MCSISSAHLYQAHNLFCLLRLVTTSSSKSLNISQQQTCSLVYLQTEILPVSVGFALGLVPATSCKTCTSRKTCTTFIGTSLLKPETGKSEVVDLIQAVAFEAFTAVNAHKRPLACKTSEAWSMPQSAGSLAALNELQQPLGSTRAQRRLLQDQQVWPCDPCM